jgi:hypothetical protein
LDGLFTSFAIEAINFKIPVAVYEVMMEFVAGGKTGIFRRFVRAWGVASSFASLNPCWASLAACAWSRSLYGVGELSTAHALQPTLFTFTNNPF